MPTARAIDDPSACVELPGNNGVAGLPYNRCPLPETIHISKTGLFTTRVLHCCTRDGSPRAYTATQIPHWGQLGTTYPPSLTGRYDEVDAHANKEKTTYKSK